jgi:hypothetical protein
MLAHHISMIIAGVARPENACCMHTCDNPSCVNPKHLRWGTLQENNLDMYTKGRQVMPPHRVGSGNPSSKLSEDDVRKIRSSQEPQHVTAKRFGITQAAVSLIVTRKKWQHVS